MKWMLATVILLVALLPAAQGQAPNIEEWPVNIAAPPLMITAAHAGWQPPAWASDAHKKEQPKYQAPVLPVYFQIQNASQKTIYAYRIIIVIYDAFGDYIDTIRASTVVALAPQVTDYGRWSLPMRYPYLTWTMVYYLEAVRFQDGAVWRIDPESVAALVPSSAPGIRFHSWHIIPDPREVLPQQPKDAG